LSQPKPKPKMGRQRLPKGQAKERSVQVRFSVSDLKRIAAAAKANRQTVSEWIRSTLNAAA
jgi:hypothetical protein